MCQDRSEKVVQWDQYDAVLFDLDGVLTDTASVHAACWKRLFDQFLRCRAEAGGEGFRPFDIGADYRVYVDGRPRFDGARSFLESRGIHLPEGQPDAAPGDETVCALANHKDGLVNAILESDGVKPYPGSVELIHQLSARGVVSAVVSSSRNCRAVLAAAGIASLFEVVVDGEVGQLENLRGKPAPDTFLRATQLLAIEPRRSVVVEDATSGVQAGRDGGFGLVIGVDRVGHADELRRNGADLVVKDLSELLE
jgi:beta-phosphoglucomutase family hydrolase